MVVIVWRIAQHRSVPSSAVSVLDVESSPRHPDNGKRMNKSIKKNVVEFVFRMVIFNILLDIKHPFEKSFELEINNGF
jgi:hypothetical protein